MSLQSVITNTQDLTFYARLNESANLDGTSTSGHNCIDELSNGVMYPVGNSNIQNYGFEYSPICDRHIGRSFCVSPNGFPSPSSLTNQECAYLELEDSGVVFPFIQGGLQSFSIECVLGYTKTSNMNAHTSDQSKSLIYRQGLIDLSASVYYTDGSISSLTIVWPTGTYKSKSMSLTAQSHVLVTWSCTPNSTVYDCVGKVYINGQEITDLTLSVSITVRPTIYSNSMFFLGRPSTAASNLYKWVTPIYISDIAIYNKALSLTELNARVEMLFLFGTLLNKLSCSTYNNFTEYNTNGYYEAQIGSADFYVYGANTINQATNMSTWRGGTVEQICLNTGLGAAELESCSLSASSTVLISIIPLTYGFCLDHSGNNYPYDGLSINIQNTKTTIKITSTISTEVSNSDYKIALGSVLSIGLIRSNNLLKLYINGTLALSKTWRTTTLSGELKIGAVYKTDFNSNCKILEYIYFSKTLEEYLFTLINNYGACYTISGVTVEQGYPTSCKIRVYDSLSGELLQTTNSDKLGKYTLYFGSPNQVDLIVIASASNRARALINLTPAIG